MSFEKKFNPEKSPKNKILNTWVMDTTQAMRKGGGRDLADYKEFLDFNEKELDGKTVLDLGSGSLEKLTRNLREKGIEADVVSLNPDYTIPKYRRIINNQEDWQRKSVAGLAQSLPFEKESFDFILGVESVTMYEDAFKKPLSAEAWSKEIARVLKPGGEARLGEILGMGGEERQKAWQKIIEILQGLGLEARIETFKIREKNPIPRYRIIIKKLELK